MLGNLANKELLLGYLDEDQSWREIAEIKNVSNFLQATSYRMLDNLEYEEVGSDGRIAHGKLGELSAPSQDLREDVCPYSRGHHQRRLRCVR